MFSSIGTAVLRPMNLYLVSVMAKEDPITCAKYAKYNDLLDTPGWKSLKGITTREVKFTQMINNKPS
jgi:hypothetical protein